MELYDYELAACAQKVRLALAEKGLPWTRRRVDIFANEHKTEAYRSLNPAGLVPVLVAEGRAIAEADTIGEYLDDVHPEPALRPAEPLARAHMRNWLRAVAEFHMGYGAVWYEQVTLPYHRRRGRAHVEAMAERLPSERERNRFVALVEGGIPEARIAAALAAVAAAFARMERELTAGGDYLGGPAPSLADLAMLPYVDTPLEVVSALWFGRHRTVADWLGRMRERTSYAEAITQFEPDPDVAEGIAGAPAGGGRRQL